MFNFPTGTKNHVQVFKAAGNSWQIWNKPVGASIISFYLIGGGGAGGNGRTTGTAGTNRAGGGGGGSAPISILTIQSSFLPNTLFVKVGMGGAAAAADGGISSVSIVADDSSLTTIVIKSANTGAGGGGTGGAATGSAGNGGSAFSGGRYTDLGHFFSLAGQAGTAAGLGDGVNVTPSTTTFLISGASGAGTPSANTNHVGGGISASGIIPALAGGIANGGFGISGFFVPLPLTGTGGTGGGSSGAGTGGNGGNGALGCGGGGGGAGVTPGTFGRGGDGIIYIISH